MGLLQINTLGTSFAIKAAEDDDYLKQLLDYYTQITKKIEMQGALSDKTQIAILAGILICDELYKEKENSFKLEKSLLQKINKSDIENESTELNKITKEIISKLERVL